MTKHSDLVPLLTVRGAGRALDFYQGALGARVLARYEHGAARQLSHADLQLGDAVFSVTEEARGWSSDAPESLGGCGVVMQLFVSDAAATLRALELAGASVVFPLQELLGERMARVRDPFGHLWLLRERVEELTVEELQRRRDALYQRFAGSRTPSISAPSISAPPAPLENMTTVPPRAAPAQAPTARIHLILGPVGAGKSTFALELARRHAGVRLTLDEWMTVLFRPDRPEAGLPEWYIERASRCVEQIWALAQALVASGTAAVLEIGLLQRAARAAFYRRVEAAGCGLSVYVLDAPRDLRRARVLARNEQRGATFSMPVPPEIFELASDLWEPLAPEEAQGRELSFIDTGAR
ncbi:MAG TPA: AAA family ATPase [Polyangiaceae bacterium]|nr:AAA family ATPase [Polyangiaceae bacterium]